MIHKYGPCTTCIRITWGKLLKCLLLGITPDLKQTLREGLYNLHFKQVPRWFCCIFHLRATGKYYALQGIQEQVGLEVKMVTSQQTAESAPKPLSCMMPCRSVHRMLLARILFCPHKLREAAEVDSARKGLRPFITWPSSLLGIPPHNSPSSPTLQPNGLREKVLPCIFPTLTREYLPTLTNGIKQPPPTYWRGSDRGSRECKPYSEIVRQMGLLQNCALWTGCVAETLLKRAFKIPNSVLFPGSGGRGTPFPNTRPWALAAGESMSPGHLPSPSCQPLWELQRQHLIFCLSSPNSGPPGLHPLRGSCWGSKEG